MKRTTKQNTFTHTHTHTHTHTKTQKYNTKIIQKYKPKTQKYKTQKIQKYKTRNIKAQKAKTNKNTNTKTLNTNTKYKNAKKKKKKNRTFSPVGRFMTYCKLLTTWTLTPLPPCEIWLTRLLFWSPSSNNIKRLHQILKPNRKQLYKNCPRVT